MPGLDDLSSNLAVSPDGNRLAFVQRTISCGDNGCGPDEPRLLIAEPDRATVVEVSLPESGHTLVWSPDGNRLLFGGFDEVRSIALESGSPPIVYTSGKLNLEWSDWELTWQPVFEDP